MKKVTLFIGLLICCNSFSQTVIDTTYAVRGFTCQCKYNINSEDDSKIFDRSEKAAHYPGGEDAWKKFVKKNREKGMKGKHEVEVRFQVDKNGDLSSFLLMNKSPNVKYEEVLRLLKLSGKWFPSVQNGFCVKSYVRLSFEL